MWYMQFPSAKQLLELKTSSSCLRLEVVCISRIVDSLNSASSSMTLCFPSSSITSFMYWQSWRRSYSGCSATSSLAVTLDFFSSGKGVATAGLRLEGLEVAVLLFAAFLDCRLG